MQKWAKVDEIKVEVGLIRANMMYHKGRGFESRHRFESTAASISSHIVNRPYLKPKGM